MKLASYNLENLFVRPAIMNLSSWKEGVDGMLHGFVEGKPSLDDIAALNDLIAKKAYSNQDKQDIKAILDKYEFGNRNRHDRPFAIVEVREKLFKVPKGTLETEVVADGRNDWVGWIDLVREEISYESTFFTAKVLHALNADVVATIEVENRTTLGRFNNQILDREFKMSYPHLFCVDGNDTRGIDVGVISRFPINWVRSHADDKDESGVIFSRDCPEYEVTLPDNSTILIIPNHFKSKGYGVMGDSDAKRKRQAIRTAAIYDEARARGVERVAVVGDLNDTPDSGPLAPLFATDLKDVSDHAKWPVGESKGTYGTGNAKGSKIDYILLSPELFSQVTAAGIERRGIYAPSLGRMWPGITKTTQASDHAALWVELNI